MCVCACVCVSAFVFFFFFYRYLSVPDVGNYLGSVFQLIRNNTVVALDVQILRCFDKKILTLPASFFLRIFPCSRVISVSVPPRNDLKVLEIFNFLLIFKYCVNFFFSIYIIFIT